MYIPGSFAITDPVEIAQFLRQHSFATVVSNDPQGVPFASHVPLKYQPETSAAPARLTGHLARANEQWQHFQSRQPTLAIFQGPHAYVSPTWIETQPAVPTWNYAVAHVVGLPRLITDAAEIWNELQQLIRIYEAPQPVPWTGKLPDELRSKLLNLIVGFELEITHIECKFKLSQNRSPADQQQILTTLESQTDPTARQLAELMRRLRNTDEQPA